MIRARKTNRRKLHCWKCKKGTPHYYRLDPAVNDNRWNCGVCGRDYKPQGLPQRKSPKNVYAFRKCFASPGSNAFAADPASLLTARGTSR